MKTTKLFAFTLCLLLSFWATPVMAQSDRGSITGTVTDPSGAAISGAKITATNLETGETRDTTTGDEGNYTLPELKAGPYKLTAELQGFKLSTIEDLQVAVQVTRRVDIQLEVGNVTDVVTVTTDAPVIQAESAVRQTNVTERQVKELPLAVGAETAGRTPLSFIFLDSNVSSGTGSTGRGTDASNFRVSGGQGLGTDILIDGASTRRAQNGTFFTEVAPGPNAFQEFTISTSTYSAEFGSSTGGIVNFTIKSGGNEFHGEAYDLFRNEALNANSFLNNFQGFPTPLDRQNNFGANIGGPVWIPKVYNGRDRTFFFFNYEGYRFTRGENVVVSVPTLRMRQGDFSELLTDPDVLRQFPNGVQIYDPTQPSDVRQAIPGNRLDLFQGGSLIDPAGLAILQRFPEPTSEGVFRNYVASSQVPIDMNSFVTKIDQVITGSQRLSFSYSYRKQASLKGGFPRFPLPFIQQDVWDQTFRSHYARLQHDYSISPTLLNHFNAGWSRIQVANRNTTEGFRPSVELGFPADATQDLTFPRVGFPGYGDILSPEGDVRSYQNIGSTFFTDSLGDNTVQFSDFVTWVKGRHTLKFGANAQWQQFNVHQFLDAGGTFNFRHDQTAADRDPDGGWPIASLVTGATEFSFVNFRSIDPGWRYFTPSFFVNDDFKITPRLTLNLGIRYDIPYPRTEARDRFRGFSPDAINPAVGRPGAIIGAGGQGGLQAEHEGLVETDYSNISPRFGFAYSLDNRTVVRGGAGIYYSPLLYGFNGQNSIAEGTLGYSTGALRTPNGRNATFFLSDFPPLPAVDPNGQFIGSDVDYFDPNFKTGRTVQWSLDVQRELFSNFALSIGYIGHKGTRLKSNFERLNAIPLDALRLGFPLLTKPLADVTPAERAYAASVGVPLPANPNAVFLGFNGNVAQALKPFPQYGIINNQLESQGQSWYNALQIKVERRFTNGLQFGASYTFSKLITNAAEDLFGASPIGGVLQNPYDRQSLRTVSPNNAPHVFVMNYLFELPFGRGRRFFDRGGWVDRVVGGWQIGGIHRYQSGLPIVAFTSENTDFLRVAGFNGNLRLNLTGNSILFDIPPNGVRFPAVNRSAFVAPPNFQAPPTTDVTSPQYAAFYADPLRFFGNAPPVLEDARLLPYSNEDFSIMKKTRVTETVVVEFRTEFFNLFNRARYFFPDQDFRNPASFGFSGIINDPNISAPRSIQLGLKVIF